MADEGAVYFNVALKADVNTFDNWMPEQIEAFYAGMAKVLAVQETSQQVSHSSTEASGE